MKRLLLSVVFLAVLTISAQPQQAPIQAPAVAAVTIPARPQFVPDCSNCTDVDWGREWHPQHQQCTANSMTGCGFGCNCFLGFLVLPDPDAVDFFGGAFTADGGFRVDRPGLLGRARVQKGDVIYLLNGAKPTRAVLARFTREKPARRVLATWNSKGKLSVRLYQ